MPMLSGPNLRPGGGSPAKRILIVLVCVSLALVTIYSKEGARGPVHLLRSAVKVVAMPFELVGSFITAPLDVVSVAFDDAAASEETLSELREENARLLSQLAELEEYKLENARLSNMLSLSSAYGTQGLGARVIGMAVDDWSGAATIDVGSAAGVSVGMPVSDGNGVVGQVTEVSLLSSTVTLVSDPNSGVGALLQNSRDAGVLRGSIDGALRLEYIPVSTDVSVGELVVTSGLGGVYPKGMLLGVVSSVTSVPSDVYLTINVTPVFDENTLDEVYVITSYDAFRSETAAETLLTTGSLYAEMSQEGAADAQSQGGM